MARTQFEYARLLLQHDEAARATAREIGMASLDQRIDALVAADARLAQLGAPAAAREAAPGVTAGRFILKGEFWNVGFGGTSFQLKAILGLTYIAHLLRHPRSEFHVTDLIDLVEGRPVDTAKGAAREASTARSLGDAGEVLDAQAKAEYRRRLAELREELDESEELNDLGRVDRARDEIEALSDQLAEGIGLGGRQRRVASHVERARVSVTKRIAIAIKKVNEHDPALAAYLRARIKTGTLCGYEPDPGRPVVWEL